MVIIKIIFLTHFPDGLLADCDGGNKISGGFGKRKGNAVRQLKYLKMLRLIVDNNYDIYRVSPE